MQQQFLFAVILASSASALPWGPGGSWAPPSDGQDPQWSNPDGVPSMTRTGHPTWTGRPGFSTPSATLSTPVATTTDSSVPVATSLTVSSDYESIPVGVPSIVPTSAIVKNQLARPTHTGSGSAINTRSGLPSTTEKVKASSSLTTAKSSAASSISTSSSSPGNAYQDMVVNHHNVHRANHSAPALKWDASLASTAGKIAKSCNFAHNMDMDKSLYKNGYGQNIQAGSSADNVWQAITESFYNGEVNAFAGNYGQANPSSNFEKWGHFSQLVWKSTTAVGCATVHCPNGVPNGAGTKDFTVCNYTPAGNFANDYAKNVGKSLNQPTVDKAQAGTY